jgi:hypothetical protein
MVGQPGEPITNAHPLLVDDPAQLSLDGGASQVHVAINQVDYQLYFGAPAGQSLQVGEYGNAQRYPFEGAGYAGLSIYGNGVGCNTLRGRFVVKDIHLTGGVVDRFWAVYEQHCDSIEGALFGEVRINEPASAFPIKVEPRAVNWPVTDVGAQGTSVPITVTAGQSATSVSTVALQGTNASDFHIASDGCSGASLAAHATCTVDIFVQPTTGTDRSAALAITDGSANVTTVDLKMLVQPVVTGISPVTGGAAGGTAVTIKGRGFTGASAVTFGDTAATGFSVDSASQITATAPAHTTGGVAVLVTGPHGHSFPLSDYGFPDFTYVGPPGAPTSVTATADGASGANVSFGLPASDGGAPIESYTVTSSPGGVQATGASSPIHVTGLEPYTTYTFTVVATTVGGSGPPSDASNAITTLKSTSTNVLVSAPHSIFGQPLVFAGLVETTFLGTPTGTVQFDLDGDAIEPPVAIDSSGLTTAGLAGVVDVGSTIGATYSGDSAFDSSYGELSPDIQPARTAVSLRSSANPAAALTRVVVTAHVSNVDTPPAPFGSVQFLVNGQPVLEPLGLNANSDAGIVGALPAGTYTITALYHDDTAAIPDFADSSATMTQTVNAAAAPPPPAVGPSPSATTVANASFILGRPSTRAGAITLSVESIDPGRFTFSATTVRKFRSSRAAAKRSIRYGSGAAISPGGNKPVKLTIKPTAKARALLKKQKKLRVRIVVTFQSARGGAPKKLTEYATVTSKKSPGGRAALHLTRTHYRAAANG